MIPSDLKQQGFTSLNPYESVLSLTANSPEELAAAISSIKAPIKILGFNTYGSRQVVYFLSNGFKVVKSEPKKTKG